MTEEPEYEHTSGMTQSAMRSSNLALVFLRVVEHSGHVSRAGIAQQLGMTRSTVSRLVDELISGDLVSEGEAASAGRGRPRSRCSSSRGPRSGWACMYAWAGSRWASWT